MSIMRFRIKKTCLVHGLSGGCLAYLQGWRAYLDAELIRAHLRISGQEPEDDFKITISLSGVALEGRPKMLAALPEPERVGVFSAYPACAPVYPRDRIPAGLSVSIFLDPDVMDVYLTTMRSGLGLSRVSVHVPECPQLRSSPDNEEFSLDGVEALHLPITDAELAFELPGASLW
jgi:hypothetical protein